VQEQRRIDIEQRNKDEKKNGRVRITAIHKVDGKNDSSSNPIHKRCCGARKEEPHEQSLIPNANTIVHNWAMMIKSQHAIIAIIAVFTTNWSHNLTDFTELIADYGIVMSKCRCWSNIRGV
jgi:hypothetical protein